MTSAQNNRPFRNLDEGEQISANLQLRKDILETAKKPDLISASSENLTEEERKRLKRIQSRSRAKTRHRKKVERGKVTRVMLTLPLIQYIFSMLIYLFARTGFGGSVVRTILLFGLSLLFLILCYLDARKLRHMAYSRKQLRLIKLIYLALMIVPPFAIRMLANYDVSTMLLMLSEGIVVIYYGFSLKAHLLSMAAFYGVALLIVLLELPITRLRHRMGF